MIVNSQNKPRPIGQVIGQLARSFFKMLGEFAQKVDELPLEAKQEIKEGVIRLLSRTGKNRATLKLLTEEDEELSRILSACGWWILQRDINGPVKRALLRLGREGKTSEIDHYLCALFTENGAARLREKIETWSKLPYFADRKQIVLDALDAHIAGKWTLTIPALLPLVDGLTRRFRRDYLRRSKNSQRVMSANKFADYYRRNQPKLFGKSFVRFVREHMFATFDFSNGASPSTINRHAILHGEIFDYATEANSLRVFLLLDTMSQFVQVVERRRKTSGNRLKQIPPTNAAS